MPHFVDSRINENLEVATEYFKAMVSSNQKDAENQSKQSAGSVGFIPYNISFTMDGISGIKIYNELSLDTSFLPAGYTKTTDFIVTGVDHKIQNGDWETSINLTLIPRTSPIRNIITSSLSFVSQTEESRPDTPPISVTTPTVVSGDFTDDDLWIYLAWNQGVGGASEHYKIAKGTRESYNIPKINISSNWPGSLIASNGVKKTDIDFLYTSNPQKLAQGFIDVWKTYYKSKTSTAPSIINSNGTNKAGLSFATLKTAFTSAADPANGVGYSNLVNFAYIENSFQSDSLSSATYQGMFQMGKNNASYKAILDKYKDGTGRDSSYIKYGTSNTAGFVKDVVSLIVANFKSFKRISGYPN
jgi:hypothetical protein